MSHPAAALPGGAALRETSYDALPGWPEDDHQAAFAAFRASCSAVLSTDSTLRPALAPDEALKQACREAMASGAATRTEAQAFFERRFAPFDVVLPAGDGFLTGYYEPEFLGSRISSERFPVPLVARPDDLLTVPQGETLPGLDSDLQAARRTGGGFEPYPDRAAIEDGALGPLARPLAYVAEPGEAFIVHVQGSARIRLAEGGAMRLAYSGRNGHPYTSIGRILVESGAIPLDAMSLERLMDWLKDHPGPAREVMRRNRSYIFFREAEELSPESGPIGGAGIPLVAGRSLAIDRSVWSYGLPVWLDGTLPLPSGSPAPLRRLMVSHDTGSAIVGPARGDYFAGPGPSAGTTAGLMRHPVRFTVLLPRP